MLQFPMIQIPFVQVLGEPIIYGTTGQVKHDITSTCHLPEQVENPPNPSICSTGCLDIHPYKEPDSAENNVQQDTVQEATHKPQCPKTKGARKQLPDSISDVTMKNICTNPEMESMDHAQSENNLFDETDQIPPRDESVAGLEPQIEQIPLRKGRPRGKQKKSRSGGYERSMSIEPNRVTVEKDSNAIGHESTALHPAEIVPSADTTDVPRRQLRTRHKSAPCVTPVPNLEHDDSVESKQVAIKNDKQEDGKMEANELEHISISKHPNDEMKVSKTSTKGSCKATPIDLTSEHSYVDSDVEIIGAWASSEYQPLPVLKKKKRRRNNDPSCMLKKKKKKANSR